MKTTTHSNTAATILLVDAIRESYVADKGLAYRVKLIQDHVDSICKPLTETLQHVACLRHDAGFAEACAHLPELEAVVEHVEYELELRGLPYRLTLSCSANLIV